MFSLAGASAALTVGLLLFILAFFLWKGGGALDLAFLFELPRPPGEIGGGMGNAILGSLKVILIAASLGAPAGFLAGVYLAEFGEGWLARAARAAADLLSGVPSIVIGIFVYLQVVLRMRRFSAFAGGVALALILIPVVVRTTEQFLREVPVELRESALVLGASRWRALATVVAPAASRGILTGLLLGLARIAGETAPLLFTSFNSRYWSQGALEPTATLPVTIFAYAMSPYDDWRRQAWAGAFVLLILVMAGNIGGRLLLSGGSARPR
jgi:phosphate transport system permease protein